MELVDTHCHLDLDHFDGDRDDVIRRAWSAGIRRMIVIAFDRERWVSGAALANEVPGVSLAVGLHPTVAESFTNDLESDLKRTAIGTIAVAIGETGLDYHWKADTAPQQRSAFERQIALAKELDLPFIVHQRAAAADALEILRSADPPHRGVMHCFTEDRAYAEGCVELGMHLGLGGAVTYAKAKALHEVATSMPLDRLLLETDSPYMTPTPHRGKRNEPSYLTFIVRRIAELRGEMPETIASQTTRNAATLFRLPPVEPDWVE